MIKEFEKEWIIKLRRLEVKRFLRLNELSDSYSLAAFLLLDTKKESHIAFS